MLPDGVGDISSLHLALSLYISWMDDIHDRESLSIVLSYDPLCMSLSIGCASLGCEEYYDILSIWIECITECYDVLLYHIVWLCIYRYDDDMFEMLRSA
jgi:hypothetical protein